MDTSAARRAIFSRIRAAQNRPPEPTAGEHASSSEYMARHSRGPQPALGDDLVERFKQQALRMSDTLDAVDALQDVPGAVRRYLDLQGISPNAVAWRDLDTYSWGEAGINIEFRPPGNDDLVGITGSFCAVAETGTLMLLSGRDTYSSASLLPETHIAIVHRSRIVGGMEDAFALARNEYGELPRAVNFISGPSRTGDIEQTIVLGAHGPYRVHVILVQSA